MRPGCRPVPVLPLLFRQPSDRLLHRQSVLLRRGRLPMGKKREKPQARHARMVVVIPRAVFILVFFQPLQRPDDRRLGILAPLPGVPPERVLSAAGRPPLVQPPLFQIDRLGLHDDDLDLCLPAA